MDARSKGHGESGSHSTLHAHGNGEYHLTDDQGNRTEHQSFGHAVMELARRHGPAEADHMHVAANEDGFVTHHVVEGGKVQGPHEHKTVRELKRHISSAICGAED